MAGPSPICTVNGGSAPVDVAAGSTVSIALAVSTGAQYWSLACISTDETNSVAAIATTLVINGSAKTATFTAPAAGSAVIFQSIVGILALGRDANNQAQPAFTTTFKVNVKHLNSNRVIGLNETLEQGPTGWAQTINQGLRSVPNGKINLRWFGAQGNWDPIGRTGTDDTAAFNAAIAATPEGGTLIIPRGYYLTTSGIIVTKTINIEGESSTAAWGGGPPGTWSRVGSVIKGQGNHIVFDYRANDPTTFTIPHIKGMQFEGDYSTGGTSTAQHALHINTHSLSMTDVSVADAGGHGIFVEGCTGAVWHNIRSYSNHLDGLSIDAVVNVTGGSGIDGNGNLIKGINCGGNGGNGISVIDGSQAGCVLYPYLIQNAGYAIYLGSNGSGGRARPPKGWRFQSIWEEQNGTYAAPGYPTGTITAGGPVYFSAGTINNALDFAHNVTTFVLDGFADGGPGVSGNGQLNEISGLLGQGTAWAPAGGYTMKRIPCLALNKYKMNISGASPAINQSGAGSLVEATLTGNVTNLTLGQSLDGMILKLVLIQGAGSPWTLTWSTALLVNWIGGNAPVITPVYGARDVHEFYYDEALGSYTEVSRNQNVHSFDPRSLSGLTLYLRADLGVTLNSGNVSAWLDQGPSGFTFAQTTGTKQPPLVTADTHFNGKASIQFGSGGACLRGGLYEVFGAGATTATIVCIARTSSVGNGAPIIGKEYSADCWYIGEDFSSGGKIMAFFKSGAAVAQANAQSLNATHAYLATYASAVSTVLYQDGTAQTTTATATGAIPSTTDWVTIGAQDSGSGQGNYYSGNIAEIVAYNRVLSASEIAALHAYYQTRYGTP